MNNKYEVGQVIYLLGRKDLKIVPALIVEEVIRKTVNETTSQFLVKLADNKETVLDMEKVSQDIFSDIDKLKEHMIENTRISVEKLVDKALEQKELAFGPGQAIEETTDVNEENNSSDEKLVQNEEEDVIINNVEQNFNEQLKLHA